MKEYRHVHRIKTSELRGFDGPVAQPENRAAHGNVVFIDTCSCGAKRRTNVNGRHTERGPWVSP